MPSLELAHSDAIGLAQRIRSRDIGVEELLDATLARIEAIDASIGAINLLTDVVARGQVEALDYAAPFAGVPILIKDLGANVAGLPQVAGCRHLARYGKPALQDDELVRRYKAAGFVILGKSTVPEFGLNLTTEPEIGPKCRNPWELQHSAGGSSGGSAAAVSAGLVPLAHATDAAGSIRVPAACCGLVGLKPGRDVMPQGLGFGNYLLGLASEHVLTRTVRDSAAVFHLTRMNTSGPPRTGAVEVAAMHGPPGPLRIGLATSPGSDTTVSRVCIDAVEKVAAELESLGHIIEPVDATDLTRSVRSAATVFANVISANLAHEVDRLSPRPADDGFEPTTWAIAERGRGMSAKTLIATHRTMLSVAHRMASLFEQFDLLLTPALAKPPPPLGAFPTNHGDPHAHFKRLACFAPFAAVFNVSGQPAISLPAGLDLDGLPLAVQMGGPRGSEELLLRLAEQIEQFAPWPRLAPMAETSTIP